MTEPPVSTSCFNHLLQPVQTFTSILRSLLIRRLRLLLGMRHRLFKRFLNNWREEFLPFLWKILLASTAIADIATYWPYLSPLFSDKDVPDVKDVCKNNYVTIGAGEKDVAYRIGLVFGVACVVEAFLRARAARLLRYENAMLDKFERKLADFYSSKASEWNYREDRNWKEIADDTIHIWIPYASVLVFWFLLMPWWKASDTQNCSYPDNAPITLWISHMIIQWDVWTKYLEQKFYEGLWKRIRRQLLHPRRLISEIRRVLRWIRLLRFAGPFMRMSLKLQDQLWDLYITRRRNRQAREEKEKRVHHRSLLKLDLKRIASHQRIESTMRRVKSRFFKEQTPSDVQQVLEKRVGQNLQKQKKQGQYIEKKLEQLQINTRASATWASSAGLYDQFVNLTRHMSTGSTKADSLSRKHNKYLIIPNTGFAIIWRVVISVALMLELFRLLASWRQKGDLSQTLPNVLRALIPKTFDSLSEDNQTIRSSGLFSRALEAVYFMEIPELLSAALFRAGMILQNIIDMVCFLDIFVWYFTGLLEPDGIVVPKPFFSRCILPGTLSQILDHPTLPSILPSLIWRIFQSCQFVGYAHAIRWCLALYPAIQVLLLRPLADFFFCPTYRVSRRDTFGASFVY